MLALGSSELHHLEFKQFLKRTDADLLDPAEQLATTVDDPLDHRQQQLLRCAQWTGTDLPRLSSLCSLLHWRLLSHLGNGVLWPDPFSGRRGVAATYSDPNFNQRWSIAVGKPGRGVPAL